MRTTFEKYSTTLEGLIRLFQHKPFVDIDYLEDFELAQYLYGKLVA